MSHDGNDRLLPGSVPGWGMSWWMVDVEQTTPDRFAALDSNARLMLVSKFWRAVAQGWQPAVAREDWVGPHHPFDSPPTAADTPERATSARRDHMPGALDPRREGMRQVARDEGIQLARVDQPNGPNAVRMPRDTSPDVWLAAIRHAIERGPADADQSDAEVRQVLALTLTPAGVDRWFELPNSCLDGRRPLDELADDPRAVLRAACDLAFGGG